MYVVVSIINRKLGKMKCCSTFDAAITIAVEVVVNWPTFNDPDTVWKSLEDTNECFHTDPNDGSEYAIYIGLIE